MSQNQKKQPKSLAEQWGMQVRGENEKPNPPPPEQMNGTGGGATSEAAPPPVEEIPVAPLNDAVADGAPLKGELVTIMSKDKFFEFFGSLFVLGGNMVGFMPPLYAPLQTLTRAPQLPAARGASDAIYELAEKYEWLNWLIQEDSADLKRFIAIAAFGFQLGGSLQQELRSRAETIEARRRVAEEEAMAAEAAEANNGVDRANGVAMAV